MSGIIDKVKQALHSGSPTTDTHHNTTLPGTNTSAHSTNPSTTQHTHATTGNNTNSGVVNKAKKVLHPGSTTHHNTTHPVTHTGSHSTNPSTHHSTTLGKMLDTDIHTGHTHGHPTTTGSNTKPSAIDEAMKKVLHPSTPTHPVTHTGHTGSNTNSGVQKLINKLDPRTSTEHGHPNFTGTLGGSHQAPGNTTVPHDSHIANQLDPRVDTTHQNQYGSTNTGTHSSNIADKLDPTVGSNPHGTSSTHQQHHNTSSIGGHGTTNPVPHSSKIANTLDPRVDSGSGYPSQAHGNQTAGPHRSNIANTLDPRVDHRDGSTNMGMAANTPSHGHGIQDKSHPAY